MAIIAQFLNKKWEVSPQKVINLEGLSTSFKLNDKGGKEPQQIKFESILSDAVGVNVYEEIESWKSLVGTTGPFFLGGKRFGPEKMQLTNVDVSDISTDDLGRIRRAKISLTLVEYTGASSKSSSNLAKSSPGIATYNALGISSAKNIGATSADKAAKKPTNTQLSR